MPSRDYRSNISGSYIDSTMITLLHYQMCSTNFIAGKFANTSFSFHYISYQSGTNQDSVQLLYLIN